MNFVYAILMSQFVFGEAMKKFHSSNTPAVESHLTVLRPHSSNTIPDTPLVLPDVKITLETSPHHNEHLHLKPTDRVLANEHLPVWVLRGDENVESSENDGCKLELERRVMERLGKFSFYQDPASSSAAVYYHRRREFDGMIDTRYLIHRLSIDKIHASAKTKIRIGTSGIISRPNSIAHPPKTQDLEEDPKPPRDAPRKMKTYGNYLYPGYPEILVIVSCELAQELLQDENHPDEYTSIVTYILTLFNGVDMLYSKLKQSNIKLNIAGIIIATECQKIPFMKDCYDQLDDGDDNYSDILLDGICTMRKIQMYLYNSGRKIPYDSYDVAVFLTRNVLFYMQDGKRIRVEGISLNNGIYDEKKLNRLPGLVSAIQDDRYFRSFSVIAHELAHLMNVPHDKPSLVQDEECCRNIMKLEGTYWCNKCLSWSETSEQAFKSFFRSADCCGFINQPRSLHPPGPKAMLTSDEQCQCYGYESTISSPGTGPGYCLHPLQCQDENGIHKTLVPLDGTPCSYDKVCWNYACVKREDSKMCSESRI